LGRDPRTRTDDDYFDSSPIFCLCPTTAQRHILPYYCHEPSRGSDYCINYFPVARHYSHIRSDAVVRCVYRTEISKRSITLDCLKWWNSMCHLQFDMSLPLRFLLPLILFIGTKELFLLTPVMLQSQRIADLSVVDTG
jgi:aromatic ring-opening dioxygenase LigB subunit